MRCDSTIGCLVIPHLPIRLALQQYPTLVGAPLAISTPGSRGMLIDCSPEARERGIRPGMITREAQNLCPQLTVLPDDPLAAASFQQRLVQDLYQVCPTLRRRGPGCIDLDLRGLDRHYASAEALGAALLACVDPELGPRVGIASSAFVAFVAARRSQPGTVAVVSPEQQGRLLERSPVELLPLSQETRRRLERFGLRRVGDVGRLPLTALVAQLGAEGQRAWHLAHGQDPDPFVAEQISHPIIELLRLPAATSLSSDLAVAGRIVTSRLLARRDLQGQAIRRLRLDLFLEHGGTAGRTALIKGGTRDLKRLVDVLTSQMQQIALDAPVIALQLEALELGEAPPYQPRLGHEVHRPITRLRSAVAELSQRYGTSPLYQIVEVNRWARLPEHRWALAIYEP